MHLSVSMILHESNLICKLQYKNVFPFFKNYFKNKMRDRLTYCHEWKNSVDIYLANQEITKKADEEYYKSKPLLKLILNIYFIPYNMLRFFKYLKSFSKILLTSLI